MVIPTLAVLTYKKFFGSKKEDDEGTIGEHPLVQLIRCHESVEPKDGGTLLTQDFSGEVGGFFKMAEALAIKQLKKQVEADGKALNELLEAK